METFLSGPLPASDTLIPFLRAAKLPGRTQLLEGMGMVPVLLDGAHNPGGMAALEAYVKSEFPGRKILAIFAVMRDKDFASVFQSVLGLRVRTLGLTPEALQPWIRKNLTPNADLKPDLVVVCGSLYLLGEVIPMLLPHYPDLAWFRQFAGEG
jgi:folylpolyglutamate synthase/dihydropteroate synthase